MKYPTTLTISPVFVGGSNNFELSNKIFTDQNDIDCITFETLIELLGINNIDFLKIDCEGCEYEIFNQNNLEWIKKMLKKFPVNGI